MEDIDRQAIKAQITALLNQLERLGPPDLTLLRKVRKVKRAIKPKAPKEQIDALGVALGIGGRR